MRGQSTYTSAATVYTLGGYLIDIRELTPLVYEKYTFQGGRGTEESNYT